MKVSPEGRGFVGGGGGKKKKNPNSKKKNRTKRSLGKNLWIGEGGKTGGGRANVFKKSRTRGKTKKGGMAVKEKDGGKKEMNHKGNL